MIPQHLPISTGVVTDVGHPHFVIVQQKGCRRRVKVLARSCPAALQMVHMGSDHQFSRNGLEGTSGDILSIFLPQSSINGQAEGKWLLWSKVTGRKARCPVAMEGAQTITSTPVPTNPPSALMWQQNQAAVKRPGTATFGGVDPRNQREMSQGPH